LANARGSLDGPCAPVRGYPALMPPYNARVQSQRSLPGAVQY
jgi:hypothetical protein